MIRKSTLDKHGEKHVLVMDGAELLDEAIWRFFQSDYPEDAAWLVVALAGGVYQVIRISDLALLLERLGRNVLYLPLAALPLPLATRVVRVDASLTGRDLLDWLRSQPNATVVVDDESGFLGLLANWNQSASGERPRLREIYERINPPEEAAIGGGGGEVEAANGRPKGLEAAPEAPPDRPMIGEPESVVVQPIEEQPSMTVEPIASAPSPLKTSFHTNIQFPRQIAPGAVQPLVVQLTRIAMPGTVADEQVTVEFANELTPETVEVLVSAPGFTEQSGAWIKPITVYSFADSAPAVFILKAGDMEGDFPISVDFRHRGRLIGSARFRVTVTAQPTEDLGAITVSAGGPQPAFDVQLPEVVVSQNPPPPADLELRIRNDGNVLSFELHSQRSQVGYHYAPMGKKKLMSEPLVYMKNIFDELSQWARTAADDDDVPAQRIMDRIASIGNSLFLDLFPPELQREYWKLKQLREQGEIGTFYITSDEPWIPWELVKPFNDDTGEFDDFFAGAWRICRWLTGPGPADQVKVAAARLVAPDLDLDFVKQEVAYFERLAQKGIQVGQPLRQLDEVRQVARHGGVELLHFSTHGNLSSQSIDRSAIVLEDDELFPQDLRGEVVWGLRQERPIVFINACHSAQIGFSLTGLGGWATHLIRDVRVSAFIGALWEVHDELAAAFAQDFYNRLQAGETLGEAFYNARLHIRDMNPANSTWLAYTLYGDPNIRVAWGP